MKIALVHSGLFGKTAVVLAGVALATTTSAGAFALAADGDPVVDEPVAEAPVEEPVAEQPVVEEPVAEEPVAEEPVAEEPVAEEPVADAPVEQPAVEQPAVEAPAPVKQPNPQAVANHSDGKGNDDARASINGGGTRDPHAGKAAKPAAATAAKGNKGGGKK